MQWFLIFGIIGFIELAVIGLAVMALINKTKGRAWSVGFKRAALCAALAAFIYAGFIFFGEGEATTIAAPGESVTETLSTGLPIYLIVFTFYVFIPAVMYIAIWSDKANTATTSKTKPTTTVKKAKNNARNAKSKK